jgi:uncharacterized protein with PQ loop repeat
MKSFIFEANEAGSAEVTRAEKLTFLYLELTLLLTRFLVFLYFALQTFRHIKKNGRETDRYSLATFGCLGASLFIFLIYGSLKSAL